MHFPTLLYVCMPNTGAGRWGGGCGWPVVWLVAMPSKLYTTDAYELLGLARGQEYGYRDVNKAYRRKTLKVHPDKTFDGEEYSVDKPMPL